MATVPFAKKTIDALQNELDRARESVRRPATEDATTIGKETQQCICTRSYKATLKLLREVPTAALRKLRGWGSKPPLM
ncbi:hypothetical protein E4U19_006061, partial [Claviceps sp. Clav32 group G5]